MTVMWLTVQLAAEKKQAKEEQKRKQEEARVSCEERAGPHGVLIKAQPCLQAAKEASAAIAPQDWFKNMTDKYSQFDEQGLPTHDAAGEPITDSQRKKLRKVWLTQEKKHKEYLAKKQ